MDFSDPTGLDGCGSECGGPVPGEYWWNPGTGVSWGIQLPPFGLPSPPIAGKDITPSRQTIGGNLDPYEILLAQASGRGGGYGQELGGDDPARGKPEEIEKLREQLQGLKPGKQRSKLMDRIRELERRPSKKAPETNKPRTAQSPAASATSSTKKILVPPVLPGEPAILNPATAPVSPEGLPIGEDVPIPVE